MLTLDDFASRKIDQKGLNCFGIMNGWLGRSPVLITSNRPPQDWYGCFPDPVIGGATGLYPVQLK